VERKLLASSSTAPTEMHESATLKVGKCQPAPTPKYTSMKSRTSPTLSGAPAARQEQLRLFQAPVAADDAVRDRIRELDLNRTTPLEALQILSELKREME